MATGGGAAVHTLGGNADSVEFCPIDGFHNFLAAATYTLVEGHLPQRLGQLYLFAAELSVDSIDDSPRMRRVHEQETPGIFDLKWSPQPFNSAPYLGQASANGSLSFYSLNSEGSASLKPCTDCQIGDAMCLSLDWRPRTGEQVIVSQSDGQIAFVNFTSNCATITQSWPAHDLEVWVASFDHWQSNLVYSGADDCALRGWDIRTDCNSPIFSNRREHSMGVCTITSNPWKEHMFVTGSYDERVRVWDNRNLNRPVCKHVGAQVGGGVWRLKWHPHIPGVLLGACMHGGARIFAVADNAEVSILEEYVAHASLTYGADWCYQRGSESHLKDTPSGIGATLEKDEAARERGHENLAERMSVRSFVGAAVQGGDSETAMQSDPQGCSPIDVGKERVLVHDVRESHGNGGNRLGEDSTTTRKKDLGGCSFDRDALENLLLKEDPSKPHASKPSSLQESLRSSLVATCSFYDRSLHLWRPRV